MEWVHIENNNDTDNNNLSVELSNNYNLGGLSTETSSPLSPLSPAVNIPAARQEQDENTTDR